MNERGEQIIQLLAQRLAQAEINAAYVMAQLEFAPEKQRELEARITELEAKKQCDDSPP